jgi:hypothetical protein
MADQTGSTVPVDRDRDFVEKLKSFIESLNGEQREAFLGILNHAAEPGARTEMLTPQAYHGGIFDGEFIVYTAEFWGGVAGHLAGDGSWGTIPWNDISASSGYGGVGL